MQENRIIDLLPQVEADTKYCNIPAIDLNHHIVMPGLVNSHGHAAMSLFRGLADDLPLTSWLNEHIWPAEGQWVDGQFVYDGTMLAAAEMIRSGTTCFSDMYFYPEDAGRAAINAGLRAQLCSPILEFPSNWAKDSPEYLDKATQLHDHFANQSRIITAFGPHAPYTVQDLALQSIKQLAEQWDCPIQIHLHETAHEIDEAMQQNGQRPIERLHQLGLLSPRLQCVHMTQVSDSDIDLLQQTGAHVIHCPASNMKLASGFCPTAKLLNAGVNVALGTDGAASNNNLDLFSEIHLAALIGKGHCGDSSALDAHAALRMATINGAQAMQQEQQLGSLEAGKLADMIAIDIDAIEAQPLYHPESQLVYTHSGQRVSHCWVDGQLLMKDRQLTQIDAQQLIECAQQWQTRIKANA